MNSEVIRRSLTDFFHDLIQSAMRTQEVETSEQTEHYLVSLLERFARPDPEWNSRPLALHYLESFHETSATRCAKLRHVGDTSLFLSGIFMEHLERQLVSADYYMSLGRVAYGHLAATEASRPGLRPDVFGEMSERFPDFVRVLAEISFEQIFRGERQTIRLYTRWLHTRSPRDARWLIRRGILPVDPGPSRGGH
jgi:hypothetical protein